MSEKIDVISTICNSNYEAIKNIMTLHKIEQFDLDCTYSKGAFWKNLPKPIHKTDIFPINDSVILANSQDLPFDDNSMKSIMYDPPFVVAGKSYKENKDGSSIIAKRFEGYKSYDELKNDYYNTLKELYRVCDKNGIVVMKCQDTVSGGRNHFTHSMIMNMAYEIGFYPKDLFILLSKMRLNSFGTKWTKQVHARKYHSYFWVFQKTSPKVHYNW